MSGEMMRSASLALILMFVLEFSPAAAACHNNWKMFQDSCYGFGDQLLTYAEAMSICKKEGANLVEINSAEEDRFIATMLHPHIAHNVWIGHTDMLHECLWVYSSSGKELTYTNWNSKQPDNSNGTEDCSAVNITNKLWYDTHCGSRLYFICEIKVGAVKKMQLMK